MKTGLVRPWYTRVANVLPDWMTWRPEFVVGAKFLFVLGLFLDHVTQAALEGVRAGLPGYDGRTDNLSLIGSSRLLVQGESESATDFATRLQAWLETAKDMGGNVGLAMQLHTWLGNNPQVRIWSRNGNCVTVNADGTVTRYLAVPGGWTGSGPFSGLGLDWDHISNPERAKFWWDMWVVIYPSELATAGQINVAPRTGIIPSTDPMRQLGVGHLGTRKQRDTIEGLIATWKGEHMVPRLVVWTTDATLFDPLNPTAPGNPDGRWGQGAFFGTRPAGTPGTATIGMWPSRNRTCRYWTPRDNWKRPAITESAG